MNKTPEDSDILDLLLYIEEDIAEAEGQLRDTLCQLCLDESATLIVLPDCSPFGRYDDGLDERLLRLLALAGFTVSRLHLR